MAQQYGKTWWGEKWLNSLSHIDYSNRLPRGRSYARNGSVKDIKFNQNNISAKVQGSRRSPYKIDIIVPIFTALEKAKFVNAITDNPLLLAKLLNRVLPQELEDVAQSYGIKLFPRSWNDFSMNCSCPDWAVPCKHLAAVIYTIAGEIDKNPFMVFDLHDFNILKELESKGYQFDERQKSFTNLNKFISKKIDKDFVLKPELYDKIDFSSIPQLSENLLSLLQTKPLFSEYDFKSVLKSVYSKVGKGVKRMVESESQQKEQSVNIEKLREVQIVLDDEVCYSKSLLFYQNDDEPKQLDNNLYDLIELVQSVPVKNAIRAHSSFTSLWLIYNFCLKAAQQGAFIPQLIELTNGNFYIRWIPALLNEDIAAQLELLKEITPPGLIRISNKNKVESFYNKDEQVIAICSLFLEYYIHFFSDNGYRDAIAKLFFDSCDYDFKGIGETEIPGSIQQWLSKFYMSNKSTVPLIKIEEISDNSFSLEILVENKTNVLAEPIALVDFLQDKKNGVAIGEILKDISALSDVLPSMASIISTSGKQKAQFGSTEFADVLIKILPIIKLHGIRILLPNSLKNLVRPQASLALSSKGESKTNISYLNLDKVLDFDWQVALGDTIMDPFEFMKLTSGLSGIVKIRNQYILLQKDEMERLYSSLTKPAEMNRETLLRSAITEEYEGAGIKLTKEAREIIEKLLKQKGEKLPEGLNANLRPYQARGYEWMFKNISIGFGSIIADDMGLGKTLQVLAILLKLKQDKAFVKNKALVVVPTTLISNWINETEKFTPDLKMQAYHGSSRRLDLIEPDIIITSYGVLRSDVTKLSKEKWAAIIIDEAQNIKNPGTEQTKAIKKINAPIKIAMSGTPVENRLSEYWSIFDFISKGYLGKLKTFKAEFATPIELYRNKEQLERFIKVTSPFILRRLKTDKTIISDLPDKIVNDYHTNLSIEQTAIYQNVVGEILPIIENSNPANNDERIHRQGLIFKLMTALKQICNHPNQYLKKDNANPNLSGKSSMLLDLLESIYENDEKVLIFTQYKEMGDLLQQMITDRFDNDVQFLHGGTSRKKRDEMVCNFQENSQTKTFILSIKAGGTGLNLTAANHVIHYDLWWNPAVEQQATDRAFRIGQNKNVMVYRMITRGTFEEKINEMILRKKDLADLTVATGEKWIGDLSNAELKEIVSI